MTMNRKIPSIRDLQAKRSAVKAAVDCGLECLAILENPRRRKSHLDAVQDLQVIAQRLQMATALSFP
jgi:hypothetical protein